MSQEEHQKTVVEELSDSGNESQPSPRPTPIVTPVQEVKKQPMSTASKGLTGYFKKTSAEDATKDKSYFDNGKVLDQVSEKNQKSDDAIKITSAEKKYEAKTGKDEVEVLKEIQKLTKEKEKKTKKKQEEKDAKEKKKSKKKKEDSSSEEDTKKKKKKSKKEAEEGEESNPSTEEEPSDAESLGSEDTSDDEKAESALKQNQEESDVDSDGNLKGFTEKSTVTPKKDPYAENDSSGPDAPTPECIYTFDVLVQTEKPVLSVNQPHFIGDYVSLRGEIAGRELKSKILAMAKNEHPDAVSIRLQPEKWSALISGYMPPPKVKPKEPPAKKKVLTKKKAPAKKKEKEEEPKKKKESKKKESSKKKRTDDESDEPKKKKKKKKDDESDEPKKKKK